MRIRYVLFAGIVLGIFIQFTWNRAHAVIKVDTPLTKFEGDAVYILVGKVEEYLPDRPAMIVKAIEDIKGKAPFRQLPINLKIDDAKTAKENLIEPLLKRLGPDMEIIFFLEPRNKSYVTFAFANGTWFQLQGRQTGEKNEVVFALRSAEPYFRKSFKGTTAELRTLLKEHAAGKAKLPPLDSKVEPGFGPEYAPMKKTQLRDFLDTWLALNRATMYQSNGSLFAVIPTLGVGAPLAILALLFPTVFGGVFVLFRQWMAFITVISVNSTLLLLQMFLMMYYPALMRGSWWSDSSALWFLMMISTFACAFWAWRRQLSSLAAGDAEAPRKTELLILLFMSATCIGATILQWRLSLQISWADAGWTVTVVMSAGILAGTLYRAFHALKRETLFGPPPLTTEGVILGTMLLGHLVFVPAIWGTTVNTEGNIEVNDQAGTTTAKIGSVKKRWDFTAEARIKGMYASSPVLDGDAIYASYSGTNGYATLVRLDRQTGMQKWEYFGKDDDLRQMISTPHLSDGKLYFGEGFHDDKSCRVFCVDTENGTELWNFKTAGQTESSPTVANGKLYIGAGNDGVYCFDVKKSLADKGGAVVWKYPPGDYKGRLLRFGGGMVVVGNRLYCGTGVDRNEKVDKGESAIFCFEADTGKLIWKTPAPYPVWSTPVVKDGLVYVTSGNGDVFSDAEPPDVPGGALQCLDPQTGKEQWNFKVGNGVIESPAIDAHRIYFGCRTGEVFCVNRADGKEKWRRFLDISPVIATPVLDSDPTFGRTVSVFAIASGGKVCCLNPQTGDIVWTYNLTQQQAYISTSPRLLVTRTPDGYSRQLFFGCGLGGGSRDIVSNRPVFYCLEDKVTVE